MTWPQILPDPQKPHHWSDLPVESHDTYSGCGISWVLSFLCGATRDCLLQHVQSKWDLGNLEVWSTPQGLYCSCHVTSSFCGPVCIGELSPLGEMRMRSPPPQHPNTHTHTRNLQSVWTELLIAVLKAAHERFWPEVPNTSWGEGVCVCVYGGGGPHERQSEELKVSCH